MSKNYVTKQITGFIWKLGLLAFTAGFTQTTVLAQSLNTLYPAADAYVRNGSYAAINYGNDTSLPLKSSTVAGFTRTAYLKFSLSAVSNINSAKLRIYGSVLDSASTVSISVYSVASDTWTETGITFSNAPAAGNALSAAVVSNQVKYYEFNVTDYVKGQFSGDKIVSFLVKDPGNKNKNLLFYSRENAKNQPQLIVETAASANSNASLFIENLDKFPSNDHFVFSKIQVPWTRDTVYSANHDSLRVRIHNKGIGALSIKNLVLSNTSGWKIDNIKGVTYNSASSLPLTINSATYADVVVKFIALDQATRVKVLHDSLTIVSNDDKFPSKTVFLSGLWQKKGEGLNEPTSQEVINVLGFKTSTGYGQTDPNKGDTTRLKGSEIIPSYFVRADTSKAVSVVQIAAYHGCCNTSPEKIVWYNKGTPATLTTLFTHIRVDGQTMLPRKAIPNNPADGSFTPTGAFGFKVGSRNFSDAALNPGGKIGIKVWKALDANGNVVPNAYIISNDYLGTNSTNYDYNDNMYFVRNVRPEKGAAFFSALSAAPSAVDFGEKVLQTTNSLTLNLSSLGKTYSNGSADPAITISSVAVVGENKSEFTVSLPAKTTLNPQEATTLTVNFNPASQGLKIADLLVYYNNSQSPLRVPLYGIAKASGTAVTANYRVNSGSSTAVTINGKTWSADNQYSFDNLEPYTNAKLTQIAGTDEDVLYLKEQSSNGDKKPFRYEFPVANGEYGVRLHFAELYWGTPGSGLSGGAGSRVMSVAVENQLKLINLDVSQEVGSGTALVKNIPVTVTDGKLNIDFSATVNRPMVVAVEVYSFRAAAAKPAQKATESIAAENTLNKVRVYPNPVQKTLNLQFPASYAGSANLQISDASGRIYPIGKVSVQPGATNTAVNISGLSLKPGFYYLRILSETRLAEVVKLIVE